MQSYPQQGYNPGYPNASGSQAFPAQGTSYSQQQQLPPQGYPQNATQGTQQPTYGAHHFPAQQQYGAQAGMPPQGQQQPQFGAQQQYPGAQAGGMPGSFPQGQQGFQQVFPPGQQGFQQGFPQGQQGFQQGFPQGQQGFQQSYPGSMQQDNTGYSGWTQGGMQGAASMAPILGPVSQQEQVLLIRESMMSLSGDDFDINDSSGRKQYKLDSSALSLRSGRTLKDASGRVVATMNKKVMTTHPTWQVYAGHSKSRLLVVKPDRMQGQKSVSVFLESNPQKDFVSAADFSVRSDMGAHNMWIYAKNQPIAEVSRKGGMREKLFGSKQEFPCRVLPGVDTALVVCLVTICDELWTD